MAVKFVSVLRRLLVFSSFPSLTVSCPGTPQVRRTPAVRREYMTLAGLEGIPQFYYFCQQPPQRPRHRPPRAQHRGAFRHVQPQVLRQSIFVLFRFVFIAVQYVKL